MMSEDKTTQQTEQTEQTQEQKKDIGGGLQATGSYEKPHKSLPDKFFNAKEGKVDYEGLIKSYKELEQRLTKSSQKSGGAPAQYEESIFDGITGISKERKQQYMEEKANLGKELNLSQEGLAKLVQLDVEGLKEAKKQEIETQEQFDALLGGDPKQVKARAQTALNILLDKVDKQIQEPIVEAIDKHAKAIKALSQWGLRQMSDNVPATNASPQMTTKSPLDIGQESVKIMRDKTLTQQERTDKMNALMNVKNN